MTKPIKPIIFLICLLPFGILGWEAINQNLGTNPVETITHRTGDWTLRFLLITLAVTPIRQIFSWNRLILYRRMLGLYAFFYACLHFLTYFVLDLSFMLEDMVEDVLKRPYIIIGLVAFLMLVPLAVTSMNTMMRTLGSSWVRLHRLIYIIATLGVFHYLWQVLWQAKDDILEPMLYAAILILLLAVRVYYARVQQYKNITSHRRQNHRE